MKTIWDVLSPRSAPAEDPGPSCLAIATSRIRAARLADRLGLEERLPPTGTLERQAGVQQQVRSDSRTESLSSTTDTSERLFIMEVLIPVAFIDV
jgi:hypothetical protein